MSDCAAAFCLLEFCTRPLLLLTLRAFAGSSYGDGAVPDSQIVAQIRALNQAYKSAGFTFQLAGTDRWVPFACSKVIRSFCCIDCHHGRSVDHV